MKNYRKIMSTKTYLRRSKPMKMKSKLYILAIITAAVFFAAVTADKTYAQATPDIIPKSRSRS